MNIPRIHFDLTENFALTVFGGLSQEMEQVGRNLPKMMSRVQNVTIKGMRTEISKLIRKEYATPKGDVDRSIFLRFSSPKTLSASLSMRGRTSVELSRYKPNRVKKGVSIRVLKSSGRITIKSGGKHDILETFKNKASATFIAKGHVFARTVNKPHPIILFGPSFLTVLNKEESINYLEENAKSRFLTDFFKQLRYELRRLGK